jgi:hybrid cluster-associated redox disulfide protein
MAELNNNLQNQQSTPQVITGSILIADLVESYPEVVGYLVEEYGFHCVNCFISGFEVLEDGARVHGIEGDDFAEMLDNVNKLVAGELVPTI